MDGNRARFMQQPHPDRIGRSALVRGWQGLGWGACRVVVVAWWLGAGGAHSAELPATPWATRGEVLSLQASHVAACTACHGPEGRATPSGYFPRIAGKPQEYLYQQLLNFRDGRRSYPLMGHLLERLSDDALQGMAQYFAALELPYPPPQTPSASAARLARGAQVVQQGDVARGVPACVQCHGAQLTGSLPAVPGLLGVSRDYLNSQLGAWRAGRRAARAPDCMAQVAQALAQDDVAAVSAWLAAQPVPLPGRAAPASAQPWPLACGAAPHAAQERP